MKRDSWVQVDLDGLREKLKRRGIRFAVYEPIQNALDEDVTRVDVTLPRPERGYTTLTVADDSPFGFRDLADAYTMFKRSYKQADAAERSAQSVHTLFTPCRILGTCIKGRANTLWPKPMQRRPWQRGGTP